MTTTTALRKTYLTCPVTGDIVCNDIHCAGVTLFTAFNLSPRKIGWFDHRGALYVRLWDLDAEDVRAEAGYVCDCEI
jgi:hypothetical protein